MTKNYKTESFSDELGLNYFSLNDVDDFIRAIDKAQTPHEILEILKMEIEWLGFEKFSYQLIEPPTGKQKKLYISTYPEEWRKIYVEKKYISVDIRDSYAMQKFCPFTWAEVEEMFPFTDAQQNMLDDAKEFGIDMGGMIPLHGPGPIRAVLSVTTNMARQEFEKFFLTKRHMLHLIANYVHEKLIQIGFHNNMIRSAQLSPRELEVLTWVAEGATTETIADKLTLSSETITSHIKNICSKLNASNRTQAVATALLFNLIFPRNLSTK